jgi:hypothetical protein
MKGDQAATVSSVISSSWLSASVTSIPSLERPAGESVSDELVAVEPAPAFLGGLERLVGHGRAAVLESAPSSRGYRSRTVAMLPSIGFVVSRCRQCSVA